MAVLRRTLLAVEQNQETPVELRGRWREGWLVQRKNLSFDRNTHTHAHTSTQGVHRVDNACHGWNDLAFSLMRGWSHRSSQSLARQKSSCALMSTKSTGSAVWRGEMVH